MSGTPDSVVTQATRVREGCRATGCRPPRARCRRPARAAPREGLVAPLESAATSFAWCACAASACEPLCGPARRSGLSTGPTSGKPQAFDPSVNSASASAPPRRRRSAGAGWRGIATARSGRRRRAASLNRACCAPIASKFAWRRPARRVSRGTHAFRAKRGWCATRREARAGHQRHPVRRFAAGPRKRAVARPAARSPRRIGIGLIEETLGQLARRQPVARRHLARAIRKQVAQLRA